MQLVSNTVDISYRKDVAIYFVKLRQTWPPVNGQPKRIIGRNPLGISEMPCILNRRKGRVGGQPQIGIGIGCGDRLVASSRLVLVVAQLAVAVIINPPTVLHAHGVGAGVTVESITLSNAVAWVTTTAGAHDQLLAALFGMPSVIVGLLAGQLIEVDVVRLLPAVEQLTQGGKHQRVHVGVPQIGNGQLHVTQAGAPV